MKSFSETYDRAKTRKGGEAAVRSLFPDNILSRDELRMIPDERFLAEMTKAVFKAGFVWKVIDNKWPAFEAAFWQFDVKRCASMNHYDLEDLLKNDGIIKNLQKIDTVPGNAAMILKVSEDHGSFARFIADWPDNDFIGLLAFLKTNGVRLGAQTAQHFLRQVGKNGFMLGKDGIAALIDCGVINKPPTSKTDMKVIQDAFNRWRAESGLNNAEISKILALSITSSVVGRGVNKRGPI